MNYKAARTAYLKQANRCKRGKKDANGDPVEMRLTFEEWADIWEASGKWSQRGNRRGQYCMARKDDIGHYEMGNVEIKLHTENTIEASVGRTFKHTDEAKRKIGAASKARVVSDETKRRMSEAQQGKKTSEATKMKLSKLNKGKPMKRVACERCGLETSPQNLSRHQRVCEK